ncbi:hypothetical protein MVEN_00468700 [Mycena venus]|uniref:Uncharacterized protein n=1 Tax=Mycena venus TaxID=2733690 RepID=A0A8H7D894_9AGAR|nr:hypothetical protein MVEN_00468700 [Mycena venus]
MSAILQLAPNHHLDFPPLMWLPSLWPLITAIPHVAHVTQTPFRSPSSHTDSNLLWEDLNASPDANATGHLIFDTVASLLQKWPHTCYRNGLVPDASHSVTQADYPLLLFEGHSVVPGTMPVGTLLYHGRTDAELLTVPEWTATDPEHSFPFCGGWLNGTIPGCWQLTLVATRPLKVLYFDGSSAAKIENGGTLDTQDLLVWGKVDPARWVDERERIDDLCARGKEFGLDGYLREIMLCDFSHGVELVSADYLASPLWRPNSQSTAESSPPGAGSLDSPDDAAFSTANLLRFESVRAGSWHNNYPGETRVMLDLTGFVSFYDITLAPSLISHRYGTE